MRWLGFALLVWAGAPAAIAAVNLNTASERELLTLPGLTRQQAAAIIAKRPFRTVDELKEAGAVTDRQLAAIAPLVTVAGTSDMRANPTTGGVPSSESSRSRSRSREYPGP